MIKEIRHKDELIALLVDNADIEDGTHPITESPAPLQALMMSRKKGHVFAKHTHAVIPRTTESLQEVIVITEGKVLVTVCLRDGQDIGAYEVSAGQFLFLVNGGYTIEVLEDARFYEFKNGPHLDDKVNL